MKSDSNCVSRLFRMTEWRLVKSSRWILIVWHRDLEWRGGRVQKKQAELSYDVQEGQRSYDDANGSLRYAK